jgi:hypothetical protein
MPAEPHALSTVPPPEPPAETDYDAIRSAVTATARGRWFLDEFAKRNRHSNTTEVLAAIAQMQAAVVGDRVQQASHQAHQEVRIELLEMARAIAQTRAEVAECRPLPSQHPASAPAGAAAPDVVAAAERLRQIAWTMRACGIELPASDQIGQIADAILSADALRSLGDQRAHKLTEALHYLEHRIDRMLDSRMAAANGADAEPAPESPLPRANGHDHDAATVTAAMAMIAAAMHANGAETASTPSQETAAALDATELPMDDDVVLTVADSAVEAIEQEPELAAPTDLNVQALRAEAVELEFEPLLPTMPPAAEDKPKAGFAGFELEPLVVVTAAEPEAESHPAAIDETPDEPVLVAATAIDDVAEAPLAEAPAATSASTEPVPETDLAADDDLPLTLATDAMAGGFPDQEPAAAPATAAASTVAELVDTPPPAAAAADPIAMQVDHDLDVLIDFAPDDLAADTRRDVAAAPKAEPVGENIARQDDPADFLLDAPQNGPPVPTAYTQAAQTMVANALAAIEAELLAGTTPPAARMHSPTATAMPATKPTPIAGGPLAALMAMREEERIALFS